MSAPARRGAAAVLACGLLLGAVGCTAPGPEPESAPAPPSPEQSTPATDPTTPPPGAPGGTGGGGGSPGVSGPAPAPAATSPLRVVNAWVTPSRSAQSRVYVDLMNPGFSAVDITGVRTDVGGSATLQVMQAMQANASEPLENLNIEAGQTVSFGPDGPFILLKDLPEPLREGDRVVVTLDTITGEVTRFSAFARTTPPGR